MYREANDEPCAVDRNRIEEKCNDRFIANFFFQYSRHADVGKRVIFHV